jgi:hypothetical protein
LTLSLAWATLVADSPAYLLADQIDLARDTKVAAVSQDNNFISVTVEERQLLARTRPRRLRAEHGSSASALQTSIFLAISSATAGGSASRSGLKKRTEVAGALDRHAWSEAFRRLQKLHYCRSSLGRIHAVR